MKIIASLLIAAACVSSAGSGTAAAGPAQSVSFANAAAGATAKRPFLAKLSMTGRDMPPAGHHPLLISADDLASMAPIPMDGQHLRFGAGQTETMLARKPGRHAIALQLANAARQAYGPTVSRTIDITIL